MNYSTGFWNRIAERYAKKPVADEVAYQKKLAKTQQYFNRDMKVLEFGCGTGSTAIVHAPHVGQYQAIDVSPKMIAIAQRKLDEQNMANLAFHVAAIEEFKVEEQSLDAVLGLSILHLLNDHDEVIRKIYKILKPGGVFFSSTVCMGESMPLFLRFALSVGAYIHLMPQLSVFSQEELEGSVKQTGFNIDYKWSSENSKQVCFLIAIKPT